ncbi:MAG: hydrogenase maturation nickel metallochaperone HypA [Pyrinomonadaceae bacterium]|nr:hydrogenase maturation nickel metallochaperone HypA [Pyrinomonadaceae bacterium]
MHEMSIAQSVLDIAFGEMEKNAAKEIRKIKLSIGEFSGVVREALDFAFDVLKPGTAAGDAEIEIEVVPLSVVCPACGPIETTLGDLNFVCPHCDAAVRLTGGREMRVDYLELD